MKILSDLFYLFADFFQTLLYFGLSFQSQMKFPDKLAVNLRIVGSFLYHINKFSFQLVQSKIMELLLDLLDDSIFLFR